MFFFNFFQLKKQLHMAKTADASMSKFSQKLKDEDKTTRGLGKKRKVNLKFFRFLNFSILILTIFEFFICTIFNILEKL